MSDGTIADGTASDLALPDDSGFTPLRRREARAPATSSLFARTGPDSMFSRAIDAPALDREPALRDLDLALLTRLTNRPPSEWDDPLLDLLAEEGHDLPADAESIVVESITVESIVVEPVSVEPESVSVEVVAIEVTGFYDDVAEPVDDWDDPLLDWLADTSTRERQRYLDDPPTVVVDDHADEHGPEHTDEHPGPATVVAEAPAAANILASRAHETLHLTTADLTAPELTDDLPDSDDDLSTDERLERWDQRSRVSNLNQMAHEAMIVFEPDGRYRFIAPEARWVLGYTREQLAELPATEVVHPDDLDDGMAAFDSVLEHRGSSSRVEVRIRHADSSWRWYEVAFKNLRSDPRIGGIVAHLHDITARREAEDEVRAREERFRALVQHSYDSVMLTGPDNEIVYATPSVEQMFGWSVDELVGANAFDYVHPDDLRSAQLRAEQVGTSPGVKIYAEFRLRRRDGTYLWVDSTTVNLLDHPNVGAHVQSFRDITYRKEAENQIRSSEERLRALVENADGAILVMDREASIMWASPGAGLLWGLAASDLLGEVLFDRSHPDDRRNATRRFAQLLESAPKSTSRIEGRMQHADGSWRWFEGVYTNCLDDESVGGVVVNVRDTTERAMAELALRNSEAQLEHQATHDPLTDLPNRLLLFDRMEMGLARARRSGSGIAVLFCDLDNFKFLNDSLGHTLGDEMLKAVGTRLSERLRPGDTVARFGGDEFVILAEELPSEHEAVMLAERVNEHLRAPFITDRGEVFVTSSIGIAYTEGGERNGEDLVRDADAAMYEAKERGRARIEMFDAGMRARAVEWHQTESALRGAISRRELDVYFQPVVDLQREEIVGVEALVRWAHPERGLLSPGSFISVAEQTGLVIPLGAWVLDQACTQVAEWQHTIPGCSKLWLAVNLSARQLADETLTDDLANVLAASSIDPRLVHVEVTESELMRDVEHSKDVLDRLKVLGVRVAIDDFGTGYSSFSYLRTLPVDVLKIDRSFVSDLGRSGEDIVEADDVALVEAIINLGHILRMEVIAEGVETAEQAMLLADRGCDLAQGFYFAEPVTADGLRDLLTASS
jgi:diguanylate cyclase (GGDEF)-like protein/PAS domain S-box-containing protein